MSCDRPSDGLFIPVISTPIRKPLSIIITTFIMFLATNQHLQSLGDALSQKPPYCSGTVQVPADQWTLFYGTEGNAQYVFHLSNLSSSNQKLNIIVASIFLGLRSRTRACDPTTFGVNQKDVSDESYRKAGKLDIENFASKFKLEKSGIMTVIRAALLEGHDSNRPIEAELYKLNVYGERKLEFIF